MAETINVKSCVSQAEGFSCEVEDSTLLCSRYFPTTQGDMFATKEVLFDFESSDLEKGAFITSGYKSGNTVNWIANSVVPPRVGESDVIDPTDLDRQLFERICRSMGADVNRAEAYQTLLNLKSARLAARTDRSKEVLAALILKEGKIEFDQDKDESGVEVDHIMVKYYDPAKGADNHFAPAIAWSEANSTPYRDVCKMVSEGKKRGRKYTDLVLGENAWIHLSNDDTFAKFAGATFHSDGMVLTFGEIDTAEHVATAVFNGVKLNVITYSGGYKDASGELKTFLDADAAVLISEGVGRGLQGGCTLLNPDSIGYDIENSFMGMTGTHMQSVYKDFKNQKLYIREESRPLPAPKRSVNEFDWIYCDTSMSAPGGVFGELAKGITFVGGKAGDCSCAASIVVAGQPVEITHDGATKFQAIRNGEPAEELVLNGNYLPVPADCDRDENDNILIWATAV